MDGIKGDFIQTLLFYYLAILCPPLRSIKCYGATTGSGEVKNDLWEFSPEQFLIKKIKGSLEAGHILDGRFVGHCLSPN
jgi:hypothetical protein